MATAETVDAFHDLRKASRKATLALSRYENDPSVRRAVLFDKAAEQYQVQLHKSDLAQKAVRHG